MSPSDRVFSVLGERGITAAEASRATGIAQSNFTEWRKGRNGPSYGALVKLAGYLKVSVEYLSGQTDDPTPTVNYDDDIEFIGQRARKLPPEQQAAFTTAMEAFLDALDAKNKNK